jgi:protein-disulfide isomerase
MRNRLFLCAVSVATLVNCATHQAGKPVASSNVPSTCRGNCPAGSTTALAEGKVPEQAKPVADDVERYRIPLEGPSQGAVSPKVNIVAFSDFQCPFCSQAAETMRLLLKQYPDDVRLYFRHLPLPFHADASLAAQAAMAAHAQGKFWEMHDKLFANQEDLKRADLEAYARDIGLDVGRFKQDLDHQTWAKVVAADAALASQMGVVGTPNFFINGRLLRGALPIDSFQGIIEDEIIRSKRMLAAGTPPEGLYAKLMAGARSEPPPPPPPPRPPVSNEVYKVEIGKAPRKGGQEPKITLIEFADFQCPFCARAKNTLDELLRIYKDDLGIWYRHFPLPFHSNAMPAAIAAVAADQQGKFWEMHDKLFANQQDLDAASLEKYAQEIGLDLGKFKAALASPKTKAVVEADKKQVDQFGVQGTPSFFVNGRAFSGAYPLESFKMVLDEEIKRVDARLQTGTPRGEIYAVIIKDGLAKKQMPKEQTRPGEPSPTEIYKAEIKGAPIKGAKDALVTIVQFADFQCPFSSRVQSTIDKIMAEYKGQVRVVWKDLPLAFHSNAKSAAIAARAANQQGKFWPMHDILFKNQENLDAASLEKYAKAIGLNMTKFKAALRDKKLQDSVEADAAMAGKIGARGTPAFFINGKFLSGAQPFENFKSRIDEELKHAQRLVAGGTPKASVYTVILKDARAEVEKPAPGF